MRETFFGPLIKGVEQRIMAQHVVDKAQAFELPGYLLCDGTAKKQIGLPLSHICLTVNND